MSRLAAILVVVSAICLILSGCGGGGDDTAKDTGEPTLHPGITHGKTPDKSTPAPTTQPSPTKTTQPAPTTQPPLTTVPPPTTQPPETTTPPPTTAPITVPPHTTQPPVTTAPPQTTAPPPTHSPDDAVSFPDDNLESAIREAIGKPSGTILAADLAGLTTLNASHSDIADLAGLQYCTSLNFVDLSHNSISSIQPLVNNSGLGSGDTVHIEWNPLSSGAYTHVNQLVERGVDVIWGSL